MMANAQNTGVVADDRTKTSSIHFGRLGKRLPNIVGAIGGAMGGAALAHQMGAPGSTAHAQQKLDALRAKEDSFANALRMARACQRRHGGAPRK